MTRSGPLSDDEYRSLADFRRSLRRFLSFSEKAARDHGLTPAQHQLLLAVRARRVEGLPSMSDLSGQLELKLHSVGELVDRAVDNGLVERRTDPGDARRVLVSLTSLGLEKLDQLSVMHRRELRQFRSEMHDLLSTLESDDDQ